MAASLGKTNLKESSAASTQRRGVQQRLINCDMTRSKDYPEFNTFKKLLQAELQKEEARLCIFLEAIFSNQSIDIDGYSSELALPEKEFHAVKPCDPHGPSVPPQRSGQKSSQNGAETALSGSEQRPPLTPYSSFTMNTPTTMSLGKKEEIGRPSAIRRIWNDFGLEQVVDEGPCFNRFVLSKKFLNTCTIVVVANAVHLGYSIEYAMGHLDEPRNPFIDGVDRFFLIFYFMELLFKLAVFRTRFFCNSDWQWNWFDTFLVMLTVNEEVSKLLAAKSDGGGLSGIVRILRLLKTVKMLRIIRVMRFFRELRLFLMPIVQSMRALFWTMLMLSLIMYIFSIILLQGVVNLFLSEDTPRAEDDALIINFGSVTSTMASLFMSVTGGNDWGMYAELLKELGLHYYLFFIFYIGFLMFAVLNILTGIFVESAMQFSIEDRADQNAEMQNNLSMKEIVYKGLEWDDDGSGLIDVDEFQRHLKSPAMQTFLRQVEINSEDALVIMRRLSKECNAGVHLETFLDCAIHMKGPARSLHLHEMMAECAHLRSEVQGLSQAQDQMMSELREWLQDFEGDLTRLGAQLRFSKGHKGLPGPSEESTGIKPMNVNINMSL